MKSKNPISIKEYLILIQRTAVIKAIIFCLVTIGPMSLVILKCEKQSTSKEIILSQKSYLSHLIFTNDLIELQRQFNSIVSNEPIYKLTIIDPRDRIISDISRHKNKTFYVSFEDSLNLTSENQNGYRLYWKYGISLESIFSFIFIGIFVSIIIVYFLRKSLLNAGIKISQPVEHLGRALTEVDFSLNNVTLSNFENSDLLEIEMVKEKYSEMIKRIKVSEEKIRQFAQNEAIVNIASQVSHDIRSPLTALNMVANNLTNIPEEHRLILRNASNRITDIANQLLTKSKNSKKESKAIVSEVKNEKPTLTTELLPALVEVLVSEKRMQFRDKINVNIETNFDESYGSFVNVDTNELKRVLSNLITNAVEVTEKKEDGRVTVSIRNYSSKIILSVKDNGGGIPPHILDKLGQRGVTYGKEDSQSGSGLGVYHAKKTIESFGAEFEINSIEGFGAEMRMTFKPITTPDWFVSELNLNRWSKIAILDDDNAIHSVWNERFNQYNFKTNNFTSGSIFVDWISNNKSESDTLFLVDYELLNQDKTGLQLIDELDIKANSILVTSRFEDENIRLKCAELGVKLIPKSMAALIPIT